MKYDKRLIQLHPSDNVLVVCQSIDAGHILINGVMKNLSKPVAVGHKLARTDIAAGDKVIRYGVSIGSAIAPITAGSHVHLHNMKSDYIPPHSRDAAQGETV
ncbi:UxaA family hydrolase [Sansalvadorimonas verongulae]|uniref:UxaA family hydrolase n=1 Tax=Sansalvadorimonas verongulae TaxID=2172824 RepID=UPI0012BC0D27|nr:UxaA family hydrolase [Sansalvadorimonas verongulae]MTI15197.1 altronate hydrolase [Sansalvadorimonas verongulae]